MKTKHIGIVACSYEGAALCYRTICSEGTRVMGEHAHPEITLNSLSMSHHMEPIYRDDWLAVGALMLESGEKLKRAGAEFLICPDNTIHQALDLVSDRSPLPWLHIAEEVAKEAKRRKFKKVGLTGTKYLVEGPVYPPKFAEYGIEMARPTKEQREAINEIIFTKLVNGIFDAESVAYFRQVIRDLKAQGCDAVALGCTEIPLLMNDDNSPLPTLDSTRLLAKAALQEAMR